MLAFWCKLQIHYLHFLFVKHLFAVNSKWSFTRDATICEHDTDMLPLAALFSLDWLANIKGPMVLLFGCLDHLPDIFHLSLYIGQLPVCWYVVSAAEFADFAISEHNFRIVVFIFLQTSLAASSFISNWLIERNLCWNLQTHKLAEILLNFEYQICW